ncbi:hypothetical protein, partial [Enterocloster hominis (ex Liu et al. 2021)]|uniref:hypothetical protein n=1 Tax=Enterocloster hominis (ex Liu et al. 2021) TaxID=2763663 RepID=UPI00223AD455
GNTKTPSTAMCCSFWINLKNQIFHTRDVYGLFSAHCFTLDLTRFLLPYHTSPGKSTGKIPGN